MQRHYSSRFAILAALFLAAGIVVLWHFLPHRGLMSELSSSTAVYDSHHRLLRLTLSSDQKYRLAVPVERISPQLREAVLLHEDRFFYDHPGVNPFAIARAAWQTYAVRGRRVGGSTLTMQLARLLWHLNTRSPAGKLRQVLRAIELESLYSKREILEAYLNCAPFGANVEGVGAASLIYFGKPVDALTLPEAMTLAVIPQNPQRSDRGHAPFLVAARQKLYSQWIVKHPVDRRFDEQMHLPLSMRDSGSLPFLAPHFVNAILEHPREPEVVTTLDLKLQRLLERHLRAYVAEQRRIGIRNAVAMLVDSRTMEIKASVGSAGFFDSSIEGQVDGTDSKRSPGSTLKPFLYALAIDQGVIHPLTVLKDAPASFGGFSPENFDGRFVGPITATEALVRSRNVPAVTIASKLSNPSFYSFLKSAGISRMRSERFYGLGLVLGTGEVTMEELVTLYASLANGGVLRPLRRTSDDPRAKGTRIVSEEAAFATMQMLAQNPRPDQGSISYSDEAPVYWKTGTSYGFRDAWSAGIFGPYVLAVWIGNFDGEPNPAFVGVQAAAPLFFRIVDSVRAQRGRADGPNRITPRGLERVEVCAVSGKLPGPHCDRRVSTWFIPGKSPIAACDVHREVLIDKRTGLQACGPADPHTRPKVFEFWDSDMLHLFEEAGVPRRVPPAQSPACSGGSLATRGKEPQITSPENGVAYALRAFRADRQTIPFRATTDADARQVFWFVDETYIGSAPSGQPLMWSARPGAFIVRAVDDRGRAGSRELMVNVVR